MVITVTELKQNLDKYLRLAETENILISNNGKFLQCCPIPMQTALQWQTPFSV